LLWHQLRKGRITASKFHNAYTKINSIKKDSSLNADSLVADLIQRKQFHSLATKHGIAMEAHAKKKVIEILKKEHTKCKFQDSGILIDEDHPYLAASPDLEGSCECCGDFLIEIKCPYSVCETRRFLLLRTMAINSEVKLRKTHGYYTQIQGQLAFTGKTFAHIHSPWIPY